MQFTFFALKDIWNSFEKTLVFTEDLKMTHTVGVGGRESCKYMRRNDALFTKGDVMDKDRYTVCIRKCSDGGG